MSIKRIVSPNVAKHLTIKIGKKPIEKNKKNKKNNINSGSSD